MDDGEIEKQVRSIDAMIREYPWMDFEVWEYSPGSLVIVGSIDPSMPFDVELRFTGVFFISLPMEWKTDTSNVVLSLVQGEDARTVNERFRVEQGHFIFQFRPEDYPEDLSCLIAAREIEFTRARPAPPRSVAAP